MKFLVNFTLLFACSVKKSHLPSIFFVFPHESLQLPLGLYGAVRELIDRDIPTFRCMMGIAVADGPFQLFGIVMQRKGMYWILFRDPVSP